MEHMQQQSLQTTVENNPQHIEKEAGEPIISNKKRVLRPGTGSKMRAVIAAGLVGLGGAAASGDAEAQYTYPTYTYGGQNTTAVAPGTVRVGSTKAFGQVVAAGVVNGVLAAGGVPVRVAGIQNGKPVLDVNMAAIESLVRGPNMAKMQIDPEAVNLLKSWNYELTRGVIYNVTDPNTRLNIGPATTELSVSRASNRDVVQVAITYLDTQGRQRRQLFVIGPNAQGRVVPIQIAG